MVCSSEGFGIDISVKGRNGRAPYHGNTLRLDREKEMRKVLFSLSLSLTHKTYIVSYCSEPNDFLFSSFLILSISSAFGMGSGMWEFCVLHAGKG